MKVLIVYDLFERNENDPFFEAEDIVLVEQDIERALQSQGHTLASVPIRDDIWGPLKAYDPKEWIIFNVCEKIRNKTYLEPYIISVFEYLGFHYTGSGRRTLANCLNKARAKEILQAHALPTPAYQLLNPWNIQRALEFPLIVKPVSEDASIGITLNSVVQDDKTLRRQVRRIWDAYRQPALVEEFIGGREFNVTILGNEFPHVLPLSEINFTGIHNPFARIVSFHAKWMPDSPEYIYTAPTCPARVTESLKARIEQVAWDAYKALGLRDYGRVDMRVKNGQPYILEVNPNADLSHNAGIARSAGVAGMSYPELIDEIIRLAARRCRLKGAGRPRIMSYSQKTRAEDGDAARSIPFGALQLLNGRATKPSASAIEASA